MSLPTIQFTGNLTNDPELRYIPSGTAVTSVNIACTAKRRNPQTNEWEDAETTFLNLAAWRKLGENVANSLSKGMRVTGTATLRPVNMYQKKDGTYGASIQGNILTIGPALDFATAQVVKNDRNQQPQQQNNNYPPQGGFTQQQPPQATGWPVQDHNNGMQEEQPPF